MPTWSAWMKWAEGTVSVLYSSMTKHTGLSVPLPEATSGCRDWEGKELRSKISVEILLKNRLTDLLLLPFQ